MNIFQNPEDLLTPQEGKPSGSVEELLRYAADIREKLGGSGYLVESYLSHFFHSLVELSGQDSVSDGYEVSSELRKLCLYALDNGKGETFTHRRHPFELTGAETDWKKHSFYPVVKQHFEDYPDHLDHPDQRYTVVNRHYALLAQAFLRNTLSQYLEDEREGLHRAFHDTELNTLYESIAAVIGEPSMEKLNQMLREQFFAVPVSSGFAYGLSCALLESLDYQDSETGKKVFQLLMDDRSGELPD